MTDIFNIKSSDADILVGTTETRRLKSKGQNGNELHERQKWCQARSVSGHNSRSDKSWDMFND